MTYFTMMQLPIPLPTASVTELHLDRDQQSWVSLRVDRLNAWISDEGERAQDRAELDAVVETLVANEDTRFGGFGTAPKFPVVPVLDFLLEHGHRVAQAFGGGVELAQGEGRLACAVEQLAHRLADLARTLGLAAHTVVDGVEAFRQRLDLADDLPELAADAVDRADTAADFLGETIDLHDAGRDRGLHLLDHLFDVQRGHRGLVGQAADLARQHQEAQANIVRLQTEASQRTAGLPSGERWTSARDDCRPCGAQAIQPGNKEPCRRANMRQTLWMVMSPCFHVRGRTNPG